MLSQDQIQSFQALYREEYGIGISEAEADEYGTRLIEFYKLIFKLPIKRQKDAHQ